MDTVSPEKRSQNMSAIKAKNTKPELFFRKKLFSKGYRYSLYSTQVPGHPDMFLRKYNTAVFIHGCFWHRHAGCKYCYMPKSRTEYWTKKFLSNTARDDRVRHELADKRIKCLIVWECTVKRMKKEPVFCEEMLQKVEKYLVSPEMYCEI